jgi:hypothetical protein
MESLPHRCPGAEHGGGAQPPSGRLVRGMLCWHCNTWIDTCPHPAGCAWAAYLNNPPALSLRLQYPRSAKRAPARRST